MTISNQDRLEWLTRLAPQRHYGLIVIDTALAFTPFKAHDEGQARALFRWATLRNRAPYPAIIFVVHLRKPDQKAHRPSLLEDPYTWTDEILGSVVWSASADVRLGL